MSQSSSLFQKLSFRYMNTLVTAIKNIVNDVTWVKIIVGCGREERTGHCLNSVPEGLRDKFMFCGDL